MWKSCALVPGCHGPWDFDVLRLLKLPWQYHTMVMHGSKETNCILRGNEQYCVARYARLHGPLCSTIIIASSLAHQRRQDRRLEIPGLRKDTENTWKSSPLSFSPHGDRLPRRRSQTPRQFHPSHSVIRDPLYSNQGLSELLCTANRFHLSYLHHANRYDLTRSHHLTSRGRQIESEVETWWLACKVGFGGGRRSYALCISPSRPAAAAPLGEAFPAAYSAGAYDQSGLADAVALDGVS